MCVWVCVCVCMYLWVCWCVTAGDHRVCVCVFVCTYGCVGVLQLEITEFVSTLLYFGYTFIIVFTFWILTGTIGFFAAYWFIRKIYSAIKID